MVHGNMTSSTNENIIVGCNSYEEVKILKYLDPVLKNQNYFREKLNVDLEQEIHVIIQSKNLCHLDFAQQCFVIWL